MIANRKRDNWGTYNKSYDPSDFTVVRNTRKCGLFLHYDKPAKPYKSIDESEVDTMSGNGFIDSVKEKIRNLPKYAGKASEFYSGPIGTALRNMVPSSDENARPGFAGEKHAILKLENGKNGVANYMGPGTNVTERLKRGDVGRTKSDNVAKRHDVDYSLAHGEKTKDAQLKKIREADNRMIKSLQKIREDKSDAPRNIQMGMRLIQAKKMGEDFGILDKSKFSGDIGTISKDDSILLNKARSELEQAGYGENGKILPGQMLKLSLLNKKIAGIAGSGTSLAGSGPTLAGGKCKRKSKCLNTYPAGSGTSLAGSGTSLAGGKLDIVNKLKTDIVPEVLKFIKTKIPNNEVGKIINKHLSGTMTKSTLKQGIKSLAEDLVPLMTLYKLKDSDLPPTVLAEKGVFKEALKGSGMRLAGRGMKGNGLIDSIKAVSGDVLNKSIEYLSKALWQYIDSTFFNTKMKGTGIINWDQLLKKGGSFWSDFADGFKTGFTRTLQILSIPIALLAPEFTPAVEIGKKIGEILPGKMVF